MSNPTPPPQPTSGLLAAMLAGELVGPADLPITSVDAIDKAGPGGLTFIRAERYADRWASSLASVALVTRGLTVRGHDPEKRALIYVDDADLAIIRLLELFAPPATTFPPGVHPTAAVDPTATVAPTAHIGPHCTVGPGAVIGEGAVVQAQCYIGPAARIGARSHLHPAVTVLDRCIIGERCILWPGVRIGSDGFGYRPSPPSDADGRRGGFLKIPHIGNVVVGNDVEIGANTCIDRGKFGPTTIGDGTKIDNLCQIGHNCSIGRHVIICGLAGIAGSVVVEDGVIIAGHVGIADNLRIGAGATISAKAGVMSNVPPGETWFGTPAGPHKDQMRSFAALRKLSDHLRTIKKIERLDPAAIGAPHPTPPTPGDDGSA